MSVRWCLPVILSVLLQAARPASADPWGPHQPFAVSERPSVGLFLGAASSGNVWSGPGREAEIAVDVPVVFGKHIRVDACRASWHAGNRANPDAATTADDVSLTTLRLSFVRVGHLSRRLSGYAGAGVHRFEYDTASLPHRWRSGIQGFLGMDLLTGSGRVAIGGELGLTVAETTGTPYWWSRTKRDAAVGMKLRF